jgi:hypothetical protein
VSPVSARQPPNRTVHLDAKIGEGNGIRTWRGSDDDVDSVGRWKKVLSEYFAQPALQSVAVDGGLSVARHDETDSRKIERGSARPERQVPGSYDFPLLLNSPDVCTATDALRPREAQARLTRRRTWTEALQ